jgi:hypothetical protein
VLLVANIVSVSGKSHSGIPGQDREAENAKPAATCPGLVVSGGSGRLRYDIGWTVRGGELLVGLG